MRRRDRLLLAAVLVGRAQQAKQFGEPHLRRRLRSGNTAARLDPRPDVRRGRHCGDSSSDLGRRLRDHRRRRDGHARHDHADRRARCQRRAAHCAEHGLFGARARARPWRRSRRARCTCISTARRGGINTAGLQFTAAQVNPTAGAFGEFIGVLTAPTFDAFPPICCCASMPTARLRSAPASCRQHRDFSHRAALQHQPGARLLRRGSGKLRRRQRPDFASRKTTGRRVRAAFVLRGQLYFVKERSIYSTQDDGVNEPAGLDDQRSVARPWARPRWMAWTSARTGR